VDLGQCQAGTERVIFAHELLAFSHDPDGDPLSVTHVSVDPSHGVITANPDGTWTFIPNDGFTGDDVAIRFTVSDGELTAGAEALVDVVDDPGGNQPPVVLAQTYLGSTPEDTSLIIPAADLLMNTMDPDGDPLTVTSVAVDPAYGYVEDNGDGSWTFTPTENFNGTNIPLVYTVSDGRGGVSTGVGVVDVQAVNDAPEAGSVSLGQILEDHDLTITSAQLLANSFDVDGDVLSVEAGSLSVDPALGEVKDNPDGDGWIFTPTPDFNGAVSISFTVTDGNGGSASATAALDVLPVNDPPTAGDVNLGIINEDTSVTFSRHVLLSNTSDPEGDPIDVSGVSVLPEQGSLTENPDGTWTFTPAQDFHGSAAITFTVTDTGGAAATAQAMVDVLPVNEPPVANDVADLGQILEDTSVTFTSEDLLSAIHNADGDPLSIDSVSVSRSQGSLTHDAATDTWTFTPAKNFNGKVHFDYTVTDGHGGTVSTTADLDVLPVNDAPGISYIESYGIEGGYSPAYITHFGATRLETPFTFSEDLVQAFVHDPDFDALNISLSVDPARGAMTDNGDGTWTFTPSASVTHGTDVTVSIIAEDGAGATFERHAFIRVENTSNLRPHVYDLAGSVQEGGSITLLAADILANFTDPEGDNLELVNVFLNPAYGELDFNGELYFINNRWWYRIFDVTFTPAENFHGEVPLLFYLTDAYRNSIAFDKFMYMINVTPVADVGNVDLGQIPEDHSFTFTEALLLANSEDKGDSPPSIASVSVDPAQGTLAHDGDGVWTFTPAENFSGDAKISFTVAYTDEQVSAEANLTVLPVNDPPQAVDVDFGQSPDGALYFTAAELLANSSDADGDALSVVAGSVTVHPDFGQILDMGAGSWLYLAPEGFAHQDVPISFRVSDGELEVAATALIDVDTLSANVPLVQTVALASPLTVTQDTFAAPDPDGSTITHVTGNAGDTLEIADQSNWRHESSDADHHHLVSTTGLVELYVDRDVDIHVVGGVDPTDSSTPSNDSLHVDDFFHTVLAGGGDDTITIDPLLHSDGHITPDDFTRIDGGDGFDVLRFGVDQALLTDIQMDLTTLNAHQVENIEAIDITGNTHQANTLTLDASSVIDVTDTHNALYVQGDGNDTVHVSDAASWTHAGASDLGGVTYDHYTGLDALGTAVDLYVQQHMQTNLLHP
jgi:hypothetical protein